ncbi:MAG: glycosyltransferase family 4 protein [Clostridiales bacterium]|nr:glycosyltransferase family 4 protein [Clostridiales bacterium]
MGLNIAEYIDSYLPAVDGVVTVVKNTARVFHGTYGTCHVVAPRMPDYTDTDPFPIYRVNSIPVPKRHPYRLGLPQLDAGYQRFIRELPLDVVHSHSPFGCGHAALKNAKKRGIPIVATFHSKFYDDFLEATGSERLANIGLNYVIKYFNSVDYVWSVNAATANTLRDYGFKGEITVVPNGTEVGIPTDMAERNQRIRQELHLGDVPVFLFVGQMIWQKNLRLICESLAEFKRMGHDFKMIFVGTGVALDELKALAKELGIGENTIFTGVVLDRDYLKSIFVTADLFLFPSVYDNAPLVVREAAAVCTPSLLIEGSNSAEGMVNDGDGFLCRETAKDIAATLSRVAFDKPLLERVGRKASETLPLSWETVVKQVNENYLDIVKDYKNRK